MWARYSARMLVGCWLVVSSQQWGQLWAAADRPEPSPAAKLFTQALDADAIGDAALYEQLMRRAMQADPDFGLARWHQGQVFFQGQWRSPESVGRIVSHDLRWQEYRTRLQAANNSIEGHVELARWCRREELENEEKWHWYQVLRHAADHREALGSLGVRHFQGGFYTQEEIKATRQRQQQERLDFKRYQRQFKRLVSQARRGDETECSEKLACLAAINDPAAVAALYDVLEKEGRQLNRANVSQATSFHEQLGRAVVCALSNTRQHVATRALLNIALRAPQESIRRVAAVALRCREPTSYIPLLMASLTAPLETNYSLDVLPTGHVSLIQEVSAEGPEAISTEVRSTSYATHRLVSTADGPRRDPRTRWTHRLDSNPSSDFLRATSQLDATLDSVARENSERRARNERVLEVLEIAMQQSLGDQPQAWWTAWQQYNELYVPEELPVYEIYYRRNYQVFSHNLVTPLSCFAAGTPVWTQQGPVAIERIQAGALVLSQDPITGRLDYRSVLDTTIRPPSEMVQLIFDLETITTTRGHRFWVTGEGWRMAKFLKPGEKLFSPRGSIGLRSAAAAQQDLAYNLVVSDFHTYFVGASRLFVHDSSCPQPVTTILPGVSVQVASK